MDTGPFADCPICAKPPKGDDEGLGAEPEPDQAYPLAVSMDAVTKLGHYKSCGTESGGSAPHLDRYFGPVDARVQASYQAGKLDLRSTMDDPSFDTGFCDMEPSCASSLHCARPDAPAASGPCDIHGVCGAVCMHTIPLRNVFCDMRTPEQFAYYLLMLGHLTQQRPDLKHVYIDFGCRIYSTWKRYVAKHPELPPEAAELEIMVNWMHGNGHDVACQLTNSGRYRKGSGRRVGEEIEQLWSGTKPAAGLVRYMAKGRRRDFIEAILRTMSSKKFSRLVRILEKKYCDTVKHICEGEAAVMKATTAAALAGVTDLPAAAAEYVESVVPAGRGAPQPDAWKVTYAMLLLRLSELRTLQGKASGLAVAVALAPLRSRCPPRAPRARSRSQWKPGHLEFDAALQRLREREVQRCQARVEALVLEVQQAHAEREAVGATDKEAKRIQARARRKRAQVRAQLEEMYVWQSLGRTDIDGVVRLTEEQVKQLFVPGEDAPWCTPSSSAAAVRRHHGRLFHEADTTLARAREEERYLRIEKRRLAVWLRKASGRVAAARQKQLGVCPGSVFLLDRHLNAFGKLQAELTVCSIPEL
ncbi:hypothetical protein PLESTM_001078600 [Pleodorina starrii]|nr:hypothetical protein PLESTM_001078600 [Pleodorina starrii]